MNISLPFDLYLDLSMNRTARAASRVALCTFVVVVALVSSEPASAQVDLPDPVVDADYYFDGAPDEAKVELGRLLFFDKLLSGTRSISCATCHHPYSGTADGLSLPTGEGALGLSTSRTLGDGGDAIVNRVGRNTPALFNLGAREFDTLFMDGRIFVDATEPSGFASPAGALLPPGLDNVLAVQAMFPVTSPTEMAGQTGESPVSNLASSGDVVGVWNSLAGRLQNEPGYVDLFVDAFDDVDEGSDITFVHAANAIAAYETVAFRSDDSPFDRHIRGDLQAMSANEKRGGGLFYSTAGCSECHAGPFQSDQDFHSIAMPQIGPGKGDGFQSREDFGREKATADSADRYKFRTPTLRNVVLTAPYGHDGAYRDLRSVIEHHLDPETALGAYVMSEQAILKSRGDLDAKDTVVMDDPTTVALLAASSDLAPRTLTEQEIDDLIDFLHSLTDMSMVDLRLEVPDSVPSGFPIFD